MKKDKELKELKELNELKKKRIRNLKTKAEQLDLIGAFPTSEVDQLISKVPKSSYYILTSDDYGGEAGISYHTTLREAQLVFRAGVEQADLEADFLSIYYFSQEEKGTRELLGFRNSFQASFSTEPQTEEQKESLRLYTSNGAIKDQYILGTYLEE